MNRRTRARSPDRGSWCIRLVQTQSAISHELREALSAIDRNETPEPHCLVWPEGLDRSVLPLLPLAVRTQNALSLGGLDDGRSALTAQDVLRLQISAKGRLRILSTASSSSSLTAFAAVLTNLVSRRWTATGSCQGPLFLRPGIPLRLRHGSPPGRLLPPFSQLAPRSSAPKTLPLLCTPICSAWRPGWGCLRSSKR